MISDTREPLLKFTDITTSVPNTIYKFLSPIYYTLFEREKKTSELKIHHQAQVFWLPVLFKGNTILLNLKFTDIAINVASMIYQFL